MKPGWRARAVALGGPALVICGLTAYCSVFHGETRQRLTSPDGHVIAQVNASGIVSNFSSAYLCVELGTRFTPFWHCVFGGLDYGAHLSVSWIDSKNLLIKCEDCSMNPLIFSKLTPPYTKEDRWHEIAIHYDIW